MKTGLIGSECFFLVVVMADSLFRIDYLTQ